MSKVLLVANAIQAALLKEVLIPELTDGFWKDHRPQGHGEIWRDVDVQVTTDGKLGTQGFTFARPYNLLNLDFARPNEAKLVAVAQAIKPSSTMKSVTKELIELGRIVSNRLAAIDASPLILFRGNHKDGTVTVSSARARQASGAMANAATTPVFVTTTVAKPPSVKKPTVKKTFVKSEGIVTTKTAAGATVRRVAANHFDGLVKSDAAEIIADVESNRQ